MPPHARFTLGQAFAAFLSGDAVGNVTPLGLLASEPTKLFLIRHRLATREAASSLAVDFVIYSTSAVTMIVVGVAVLLASGAVPLSLGWREILIGVLVAARGACVDRVPGDRRHMEARTWRAAAVARASGVAARVGARVFSRTPDAPVARLPPRPPLSGRGGDGSVPDAAVAAAARPPTLAEAIMFSALDRAVIIAFKFVPFRLGIDEALLEAWPVLLGWPAGHRRRAGGDQEGAKYLLGRRRPDSYRRPSFPRSARVGSPRKPGARVRSERFGARSIADDRPQTGGHRVALGRRRRGDELVQDVFDGLLPVGRGIQHREARVDLHAARKRPQLLAVLRFRFGIALEMRQRLSEIQMQLGDAALLCTCQSSRPPETPPPPLRTCRRRTSRRPRTNGSIGRAGSASCAALACIVCGLRRRCAPARFWRPARAQRPAWRYPPSSPARWLRLPDGRPARRDRRASARPRARAPGRLPPVARSRASCRTAIASSSRPGAHQRRRELILDHRRARDARPRWPAMPGCRLNTSSGRSTAQRRGAAR